MGWTVGHSSIFYEDWEAQDRVNRDEVLLLLQCREGYAQQSALLFSLDHRMMVPRETVI